MKQDDVFPSKYLKAEDLDADIAVVIDRVAKEEFKDPETQITKSKPVAYFQGIDKGLIINKTNWKLLVESTGEDDSDNWNGHKVILGVVDVDAFGDVVAAIRIKKAKAGDPAIQAFWSKVNDLGLTRKDGLDVLKENNGDFAAALKSITG